VKGFTKTEEAVMPETPTKVSREFSVTLYEDDLKSFIEVLGFFGYSWKEKGNRKALVRILNSLPETATDLGEYYNLTIKSVGKEYQLRAIKASKLISLEKEVEELRKKVADFEKQGQ